MSSKIELKAFTPGECTHLSPGKHNVELIVGDDGLVLDASVNLVQFVVIINDVSTAKEL